MLTVLALLVLTVIVAIIALCALAAFKICLNVWGGVFGLPKKELSETSYGSSRRADDGFDFGGFDGGGDD